MTKECKSLTNKYNILIIFTFVAFCLCLPAAGDAAEVRNLTMQQSGEQIVLRYDLVGRLGERRAAFWFLPAIIPGVRE